MAASPDIFLALYPAPLAQVESVARSVTTWGDAWDYWRPDPLILFSLTAVALAYAFAFHALMLRGSSHVLHAARRFAFAGGMVALAVALISPLEPLASGLLWAHMVQHMLLIAVAAPLIAYGAPPLRLAVLVPRRWRRISRRPARFLLGGGSDGWLTVAALFVALHAATVWVWHLPGPYELAVRSQGAHLAEHAAFTATAVVAWSALLRFGGRMRPSVATLGLIFVLAAQGAALGAAMTFSQKPWYSVYADGGALSPLADQQVAGLVMWAGGGLAPVFVAALLLSGWLRRSVPPAAEDGLFSRPPVGYEKSSRA